MLERPPSRAVATFLGFTGARARARRRRALRAARAGRARPGGPLRGTVARRIPEEDGVLCEVALDGGARAGPRTPYPGPAEGEAVRRAPRRRRGVRGGTRWSSSSSCSRQALERIFSGDIDVWTTVVAHAAAGAASTALALVVGLPIASGWRRRAPRAARGRASWSPTPGSGCRRWCSASISPSRSTRRRRSGRLRADEHA